MLLLALLVGMTLYYGGNLLGHADIKKRSIGVCIVTFGAIFGCVIPVLLCWVVPAVDHLDYKLPIANINNQPDIEKVDAGERYLMDTYIIIVESGGHHREVGARASGVKIKKEKGREKYELEFRSYHTEFPWNLIAFNGFLGMRHFVILAPESFEVPK